MKVLLSGASGFLGKNIYDEIISKNSVQRIGRKRAEIIFDLIHGVPNLEKVDLVIHLAGIAHRRPDMQEELFNNNLSITINLLKGLSASFAIPKKFVFISSVSVYGLNYGVKIDENQSLLANDPYGKSKVVAEDIINKWCLENNVICTILRLPLVAGPNPPGNLGAMINGIKNGYYFNISGGNSQKSMVLASDVAKFILKAAEVGGVYNLTDGYHPNFNELSSFIGRQLGKKNVPNMSIFFAKKLAFLGDKILKNFPLNTDKLKKITSTLTFDDSKARKAFGWDPTPVLKGFEIQ